MPAVILLKLSGHIISQPLAQIAKVVPILKSGDESKSGNYRPISLLSISTEYLKNWCSTTTTLFITTTLKYKLG